MRYTDEKNILILISLLKEHNVKKIVASPGATNVSFVASIQNDDYFEVYSCVDERAACYMACGLAEESGEPVAITCTGATASRNYFSGLTEAYYRKLPIIAITFTQHMGRIGQNVAQVLDRSVVSNDIVNLSVQVPSVGLEEDYWTANLRINNALLECKRKGGGPVHINMATTYSNNYTTTKLPNERVINRYFVNDVFPEISSKNVAIFIGAHSKMSEELINSIELFCEKYNGVVLCDYTSNYHGKYRIYPNLLANQEHGISSLKNIELLIDIGNITGAYTNLNSQNIWRVNPDGEIRDTYKKLTKVFEMNELDFFNKFNKTKNEKADLSYYNCWKSELDNIQSKVNYDLIPFSNIWISKKTSEMLSDGSTIHLAILNTLRSWNFINTDKNFYGYSNTGGFGIDGLISTIVGASYSNPNKIIYGFVGDLATFYDLNSLAIRDIKSNVRIMVINNGGGVEFHNYNHRGSAAGVDVGKFIAADGHNGNKSESLLRDFATNLGYDYISATNKDEFLNNIDKFATSEMKSKPIIFEVFTSSEDESNALKYMLNIEKSTTSTVKQLAKEILNENQKSFIKGLLRK
ncbi:MAG: 2-succinyl-5-enolpyruvyl-6-hydroxy-3-cyclohexene-1-carboxylate synthase [Lactobacillales bacterium]|nr:2-succinyl-5-enolpyruvyl-6-hydroxy-3-cyclohexene-1-carboxylate synthase [Lactobacillales bacterium]